MISGKQGLWGRNDPIKSGDAAPAILYIAYAYDPAGLMVGKTLGNSVEYTAVFDAVKRQASCDWTRNTHTLAGYNYAYDAVGNRK